MGLDVAGIGAVADFAGKLLDHLPWETPAQKAAALEKLTAMHQAGDLAQLAAETDLGKIQAQTNIEEAKVGQSLTSNFAKWWIAGWRPGVGWVCISILALTYIPKALVLTALWAYQTYLTFSHPEVKLPLLPVFPDIGITDLLGILGTLLGSAHIAKLRTDEKVKGAEGNR